MMPFFKLMENNSLENVLSDNLAEFLQYHGTTGRLNTHNIANANEELYSAFSESLYEILGLYENFDSNGYIFLLSLSLSWSFSLFFYFLVLHRKGYLPPYRKLCNTWALMAFCANPLQTPTSLVSSLFFFFFFFFFLFFFFSFPYCLFIFFALFFPLASGF